MSFRTLISYNLLKYLVSGDEEYMEKFISLCNSFNVDRVKVLTKYYTSKNTKLISKALNCDTYLKEIELSYPDNILKELVTIKLSKFTKTIKRSYKLPNEGIGIIVISGNEIKYNADNSTVSYSKLKYIPSIYRYTEYPDGIKTEDIPKESIVLIFGKDYLDYFTYMLAKKVLSNKDIKIKVTEQCIDHLLNESNTDMLDTVFSNKTNNIISSTLNDIYLSLRSIL
ncbi:putative transcriptional elongation factor [Flamingopox virus FGPVKD09]|uniref:Late transcription elongation factor OPG087 n=1 Tax=Flamingopox virus FGPVKD09 TaxID=2059380 RepID=A0A2H4X299_9POXV|nr:putative transcriptional elongation factor [Flamingopox virus FGPVKD09]AUD40182.1 putative transcriptional elongation factor [Flamingopox virus FGPVKD09]WCB86932.1 CPPV121 putative transcriptional elongation factor [Cooks petrelpox virus]